MATTEQERRDFLYRSVGETVHLAQTLELQVATLISLLNNHFDTDIDVHGLIVPDHRKTLGQLMQQLRSVGTADENGERILAEALEKRNRIVHEFFNKNVKAFSVDEVFQTTKAKLISDSETIAKAVAVTQGWLLGLCETLGIEEHEILFNQDML